MFTFIACAACLIVGYVGRLYVAKRWPDEHKLVDMVATKYGEGAVVDLRAAMARAKAKLD